MKAAFAAIENQQKVKWFEESGDKTFESIKEAILAAAADNDLVLLKGSHSMNLEKLADLLCGDKQ